MIHHKPISLIVLIGLLLAVMLPACTPQAAPAPTPEPVVAPVSIQAKKILTMWHSESPTTLNLHLSRSVKDMEPARIVYEPLAAFNKDGTLVPILAAETPSLENGQVASDGKSVTWKLREGLRWSDGESLTADDVVFTYQYITDAEVKANTAADYKQIAIVEALDDLTVKVTFKDVTPGWALPFVGNGGAIIPRHIFEPFKGATARQAPANTMPVGTGPYRVKEPGIKPQEVLLLGAQVVKTTKIVFEPNPYYRFPDKVAFDQLVWRGGGTITEASRQVFEEGSLDLGFTFDALDAATLDALMQNDEKGRIVSVFGSQVERIQVNRTDPNTADKGGEFSSVNVSHPIFSDKRVRQAIAYAIDRETIAGMYGANNRATHVNLVSPPQYKSVSEFYVYDLEKAKALLDEAGIVDKNGDGFREKDGAKVRIVFQSAVNAGQQEMQKLVQKDLKAIGIDVEVKIVDPGIFYGPPTNPDSITRFNCDMMLARFRSTSPDPGSYMSSWSCAAIPQKANNWSGNNIERWCNAEYDALLAQANKEMDPEKRAQMFIQLNDMLVEDVVMIPVVWRGGALGVSQRLQGLDPTPWDSTTWNIQDWSFNTP